MEAEETVSLPEQSSAFLTGAALEFRRVLFWVSPG
jgi:hypothetical protein